MKSPAKISGAEGVGTVVNAALSTGAAKLQPIYQVQDLSVAFGQKKVVDRVSFELYPGEIFGLIGETGAGKTMIFRALSGLLPDSAKTSGKIYYQGRDLAQFSAKEWRYHLAYNLGIALQNATSALNPLLSLGRHYRLAVGRKLSQEEMLRALAQVGLEPDPNLLKKYPFELSGGMRQRFLISLALIRSVKLLLLDEPTRGQDSSLRHDLAVELKRLNRDLGLTILVISHDLGFARAITDRMAVLKDGKILEIGQTDQVFARPQTAYFKLLVGACPECRDLGGPAGGGGQVGGGQR